MVCPQVSVSFDVAAVSGLPGPWWGLGISGEAVGIAPDADGCFLHVPRPRGEDGGR